MKYNSERVFVNEVGSSAGASSSQFNQPFFIEVGDDGYLYVSDTSNHRIKKYTRDLVYVRSYGSYGLGEEIDIELKEYLQI